MLNAIFAGTILAATSVGITAETLKEMNKLNYIDPIYPEIDEEDEMEEIELGTTKKEEETNTQTSTPTT